MAIDNELLNGIRLMQQGNEHGFNIVYSHTYNYVYFRAKQIMQDEQDALDLLQETYIQAFNSISNIQDPNNIYAWLGAITYRQGMKIYSRKKEVLLDEEAEGLFDTVADDHLEWNPEETVDKEATSRIISEIIDELPPLQKAALTAFYFDNMKIDQIAEVFECSSNTIKSRLNYAKKHIKTRVEERQNAEGYKLYTLSIPALLLALRLYAGYSKNRLTYDAANSVFQTIGKKFALRNPYAKTAPAANNAQPVNSISTAAVASNAGKTMAKATTLGKVMAGITTAALLGGTGGIAATTLSQDYTPAYISMTSDDSDLDKKDSSYVETYEYLSQFEGSYRCDTYGVLSRYYTIDIVAEDGDIYFTIHYFSKNLNFSLDFKNPKLKNNTVEFNEEAFDSSSNSEGVYIGSISFYDDYLYLTFRSELSTVFVEEVECYPSDY